MSIFKNVASRFKMLVANFRTVRREPARMSVLLSFVDPQGSAVRFPAHTIDLSTHGAQVEVESPVQVETPVQLECCGHGIAKSCSVKYCGPSGSRHIVGLEFDRPLDDPEFNFLLISSNSHHVSPARCGRGYGT